MIKKYFFILIFIILRVYPQELVFKIDKRGHGYSELREIHTIQSGYKIMYLNQESFALHKEGEIVQSFIESFNDRSFKKNNCKGNIEYKATIKLKSTIELCFGSNEGTSLIRSFDSIFFRFFKDSPQS